MAWQDDMLPGALNGVPIAVISRRLSGGRATSLHEFVGREDPWSEDTGRLPRKFSVKFAVVGDDYIIDRDRVLEILEGPGPYTYTDPTFGDVQVALDQPFNADEGFDGVTDFDVIFHRAGSIEFPLIVEPAAKVKELSTLALPKIAEAHGKKFSLGKLLKLILRGLGKANTALRIAKGKISQRLGMIDKFTSELAQLQDNIGDLAGTPQDFANAFRHLAAQTVALIGEWLDSHVPTVPDGAARDSSHRPGIDVALEVADDFRSFDAGEDDADITTPDGVQEQQNLQAIKGMVQQTLFSLLSAQLVDLQPDTAGTADNIVEKMVEWGDEILADDLIADDVYDAIADIQAALVDYQVTIGKDLPAERLVQAGEATPACVISQLVYGTGDHDDEITLRNNLRHPLFASGELSVIDA